MLNGNVCEAWKRQCEPPRSGGPMVFVVIPVHNRLAHTISCLESLLVQTHSPLKLVVIDDGSTDGTHQAIRERYPGVVVLKGDGSLWWTGATNMGVRWVLQRCRPCDYLLTLNNDTTVRPDYVATLVTLAQATRPSLVGSVALDSRDEKTIVDGGPKATWSTAKWWSMNRGRSLQACLAEGISFVEPSCLPGRGTLIPVACVLAIGEFDADHLPHYGADYEFSIRAKRAGYRLLMSYHAPVLSDVAATGVSTKQIVKWHERAQVFLSRRSASALVYRWRFARRSVPRHILPAYIMADTGRVVGGAFRDWMVGTRS